MRQNGILEPSHDMYYSFIDSASHGLGGGETASFGDSQSESLRPTIKANKSENNIRLVDR